MESELGIETVLTYRFNRVASERQMQADFLKALRMAD
jgi:hypothetical protein